MGMTLVHSVKSGIKIGFILHDNIVQLHENILHLNL